MVTSAFVINGGHVLVHVKWALMNYVSIPMQWHRCSDKSACAPVGQLLDKHSACKQNQQQHGFVDAGLSMSAILTLLLILSLAALMVVHWVRSPAYGAAYIESSGMLHFSV